jgi:DNA-binding HxlR family transcriptional regulator
VLGERLHELVEHGLIERTTPEDGARPCVYRLTATGERLGPALDAIGAWARAELV